MGLFGQFDYQDMPISLQISHLSQKQTKAFVLSQSSIHYCHIHFPTFFQER